MWRACSACSCTVAHPLRAAALARTTCTLSHHHHQLHDHQQDKKKKKKRSKEKHSKKSGKGGSSSAGDSDGGSGSSGDEGPAAAPAAAGDAAGDAVAPNHQREDWMTVPMERSRPREEDKLEEKVEEKEPEPQIGLRYMDPERSQQQQDGGAAASAAAAPQPPSTAEARRPLVGDGGASWRLKALKRAQEAAKEQGGSVAAVVAERWGSMAELTKSLTDGARAAHGARRGLFCFGWD